jgi:regulator of protease activity HflC (stomatin/prohibitin superfamily)
MTILWIIFLLALLYLVVWFGRKFLTRKLVRDYEVGLLYQGGKFKSQLGPGTYWLNPYQAQIVIFDKRRASLVVPGQEVATQDNVGLKVSVLASYEVSDPQKAFTSVQSYLGELYNLIHIAVREEVSSQPIDSLLSNRQQLDEKLKERLVPQVEALGLKLHNVQIRDFMFANDLKRAFNDVLKARKDGEAALERARGESAALRNLANAAKMLDNNPNLLSLRLVQALEKSSGNTFHLDTAGLKAARAEGGSSDAEAATE